jgi:hypothetical protein
MRLLSFKYGGIVLRCDGVGLLRSQCAGNKRCSIGLMSVFRTLLAVAFIGSIRGLLRVQRWTRFRW